MRSIRSPALSALLLIAFCTHALIPVGFMPGRGGLIVCHGYAVPVNSGPQSMTHNMSATDMAGMDMSGMDMSPQAGHSSNHGGPPQHEGSSVCPFAAAATTMAGGHTLVLLVIATGVTGPIALPPQPFVPRGTIVPTRLPRGPPLAII